mgnify:CR=1 FL=1
MFRLTEDLIERNSLISEVSNNQAGALVTFEGWVRDHNEGKRVSSLEYQVYESLAKSEGQKILDEAKEKFNLHHIECVHRHGHLKLSEIAIWIGATASHRDDAYKASRFVIDEIKFRLPIWKKEHYVDQESKWVFCRDHHTHVHFNEEEFYEKQDKLVSQNSLKESRVLVVGAGGLGCPALQGLTAAGVGHIEIVDFDTISISNIHRQVLYSPEVVGEKKAVVASNKLMALNPFIEIVSTDLCISPENVLETTKDWDLVLDCTDNLSTKFILHDACFKNRVPLISASVYQYEGQVRTFLPEENFGCLRCIYDETPDDSKVGNCNDFGVLGTTVSTIGSIQASESILLLSEGRNNTTAETLFFNLKDLSNFKLKNLKKEGCDVCRGDHSVDSNELEVSLEKARGLGATFIDIRDNEDIPIEDLRSDCSLVVYCHRGVRSREVVRGLREKGHQSIFSLIGGARSL